MGPLGPRGERGDAGEPVGIVPGSCWWKVRMINEMDSVLFALMNWNTPLTELFWKQLNHFNEDNNQSKIRSYVIFLNPNSDLSKLRVYPTFWTRYVTPYSLRWCEWSWWSSNKSRQLLFSSPEILLFHFAGRSWWNRTSWASRTPGTAGTA